MFTYFPSGACEARHGYAYNFSMVAAVALTNEVLELCRLSSLRINNRSRMRLPRTSRDPPPRSRPRLRVHIRLVVHVFACVCFRAPANFTSKCFLVFAFVVFIYLILRRASPLLSQCNACLPFPIFHGRYNRIGIRVIYSTFFHTEGCTCWQKRKNWGRYNELKTSSRTT